ncbi:trypsin-like serine peptidase [Nonomuraea sp. NPDC049714]|uniref:trypsin-like serine peptidase n=1 Tax=Nonomuraea sp. NPDC049714 TaxID=3364357 RepID=UPI00379458A3
MKRLLIPLTATALSAAALAVPASAAVPTWASDPLAPKPADGYSNANFWLDANGAALRKATQYHWDAKAVNKVVVAKASDQPDDGKPGSTAPATNAPAGAKVKNVNLPRTIGKVFFLDNKGEYHWCSATSIQSRHRNLVATAGHCVFENGKDDVYDKWVFVPGYYQGKAPWGVYAGAYAFTAYDLDTYDDYDGDFAFVAVHNGFRFNGQKQVGKAEYDKWTGDKWVKDVAIDAATYQKCVDLNGGETADCWAKLSTTADIVGPDYKGDKKRAYKEVEKEQFDKAPKGDGNGTQAADKMVVDHVTQSEYKAYKGPGYQKIDAQGNFTITHYFLKYWVKETAKTDYLRTVFYVGLAKDTGRLGDAVGGQGVAWNQPLGQQVTVFGYPGEPHPDGHKAFTGVTPKWCYGKTGTKTYQANTFRVETHQVLKCSMTGGADGGPWLLRYSNSKRTGYLNGVTSMFHDQDGNDRVDTISSPYFDGEVADVYNKANYAETKPVVGPNGELLK